jgi:hypothetical protein
LKEHVSNKETEAYKRGINKDLPGIKNRIYARLDKGVKELKGKQEEVSILETRDRIRVKTQLILIRKFLKLDCKEIGIVDERSRKMK